MDANEWTFAWVAIVLALAIVLISRLPKPVVVLVVSSVIGALLGVAAFTTNVMYRTCDFERAPRVDRCSGTFIAIHGEHRLPQFMQGNPDAWLLAMGAIVGMLAADVLALAAMWVWSRLKARKMGAGSEDLSAAVGR